MRALYHRNVLAGIVVLMLPAAQAASAQSASGPNVHEAVTGAAVKCVNGKAKGFDCQNTELLAFLPKEAVGGQNSRSFSDDWGWTDPVTKREFAILGRDDGTSFVEVTDPINPKYLGDLPLPEGRQPSVWHDIKVIKNYAFIVSESQNHGMQVFDLTQLRDVKNAPVTFKEAVHYGNVGHAHNIVADTATGFVYIVGASECGGGLHMVDVNDPLHPTFVGCYSEPQTGNAGTGYIHDAQCTIYHGPDQKYKGREICFNAAETAVSIADVTDKKNPKTISIASYPNTGYAHQGWLSEDQRYFYLGDELDESNQGGNTRTLIFDMKSLSEPVLAKEFLGTTEATDHNMYVLGNHVFQANYMAGLRILDISDPVNPKEVGFFKTTPDEVNAEMEGSWSNYPFFKSGAILVTNEAEGMFLIRFTPPSTSGH